MKKQFKFEGLEIQAGVRFDDPRPARLKETGGGL
jgi:hypothetical protein